VNSSETTRLDPELEYLILLTRAGLKPLSRWEAGLGADVRRAISRRGLFVDSVSRRTRMGRHVHETVFSRRSVYTALYRKRYQGTRLRETPGEVRYQGRLFGYPSCCVDAFVREPYVPNSLDPRDQAILFHWACPSCHTTPGLVREYRRFRTEWRREHAERLVSAGPTHKGAGGVVGRVAASLGLAASTAALAATASNPHWTYTGNDMDHDGFSVSEEILMGSNWHIPDTDANQVTDGQQLCDMLLDLLDHPVLLDFYFTREDYPMLGVVECEVCGEYVNMGYFILENNRTGLSIQLPYMALHAMQNGCLNYAYRFCPEPCGLLTDQVDLAQLRRVLAEPIVYDGLYPHSNPPRAGDADEDGLTDVEEVALGTDPGAYEDGYEMGVQLTSIIAGLPLGTHPFRPYLVEHEMDGVEQCEICGGTFNMGYVEIVCPLDNMSVTMPYVALHTMAHGGFAYDGTYNDGEIMPVVLHAVLTAEGAAHWVTLAADTDDDGLLDSEEAFFGLDPTNGDEDGTQRGDGRELSARMAAKISALPEGPLADRTYVIHHRTRGFYNCLVCGEPIDMGYMEIVDPVAGKSVDVAYYNHHFMELGSFSTDRDDLYPRVDPTVVGDVTGITSITGIGNGTTPAPFSFVTAPNPFGPEGGTRISLKLPAASAVEICIFDVSGRRVRTLFSGDVSDSQLDLRWDGTNDGGHAVGAGMYFCRARFGQVVVSRKLTLVR
jgi:hypothetical protein